MILPPTIPIFPLPNVVLFPNVFLPLHIFETRYRAMVKDALASDRIIGMVLLQPGFEANYEGRPRVYPVGCAGVITHSEPLPDGRYNIVLRGLEKFRMTGEDESRPYRLATYRGGAGSDERQRVRDDQAASPAARGTARCVRGESSRRNAFALSRSGSGSGECAGAVRGVRSHRTPGASRVQRRAVAMPGAHRVARNADHGRAWCELGRRVCALSATQ